MATSRWLSFVRSLPLPAGRARRGPEAKSSRLVGQALEQLEDRRVPSIDLVSGGAGAEWGNGGAYWPSISATGRYVAFQSAASNLVPGDTNGGFDVFVRDTRRGTTTRVSTGPAGTTPDGESFSPSISADGRYVAFYSDAANLVPGDTNRQLDVFVRDTWRGTTVRASAGADGTQGNGGAFTPSISPDGRYVAYFSYATNLVPGDTNGKSDVFVRDLRTGRTTRASVASDGTQGDGDSSVASVSWNGRFVAFKSFATNLVPGDTNAAPDVFVRDMRTGVVGRESVSSDGAQADGGSSGLSLSWNGRYVAFDTVATNLVPGDANAAPDVVLRDRWRGTNTRVSTGVRGTQADGMSFAPSVSADGQSVAFTSYATNLVPGDANGKPDVFVRDVRAGVTTRVSADRGTEADGGSGLSSISANGRFVAFDTSATNLVRGDTNAAEDILLTGTWCRRRASSGWRACESVGPR